MSSLSFTIPFCSNWVESIEWHFVTFFYFISSGLDSETSSSIKSQLKAAKQYLKSDFKIHISQQEPCADHCSVYALSSGQSDHRGTCQHQHNICCDRCDDLRNVVIDIQLALSSSDLNFR